MSEYGERVSSPENYTFGQRLARAAGLQSTRTRAPTELALGRRSGSSSGRRRCSFVLLRPIASLPTCAWLAGGAVERERVGGDSRSESFSAQAVSVRLQPSDEERATQTPVLDILGRQQTSHLGVGVRASNDMLGSGAPSFLTQPTIVTQQTDSSGRTLSSWDGDGYIRGSAFQPRYRMNVYLAFMLS